ncbi:MAG: ATP-binding protein [Bacteroidetes bacterium]|nr:ATP-binding protein [Bacteroidota bacterium]MBS1976029.1 ATP-binding protein [Bacteroidota bacterium]
MSYRYKIGCSLENLKGIRDFVRKSLKGHVVSEVELNEIVLALDEMCSNLMIHAHHCNPDHSLELSIDVPQKDKLIFEISDDGEMFDINRFSEPELGSLIQEKRKGGLGIRLVKSIMDEVEYLQRNGRNICRLSKRVG